jgi:hypothetical protein
MHLTFARASRAPAAAKIGYQDGGQRVEISTYLSPQLQAELPQLKLTGTSCERGIVVSLAIVGKVGRGRTVNMMDVQVLWVG